MPLSSEDQILHNLDALYADRDRHRVALAKVEEEIAALVADLSGMRETLLNDFLQRELGPKKISFVTKIVNGERVVALSPQPGGEVEFDRLKSKVNWKDMSNLPLIHLIFYLGKGLPWGGNSSPLPYELQ